MAAEPKYATPRDPSCSSDGPRIAVLAAELGKPFMPWQQQVVEVGTERTAVGEYRYEIVLVTVPRQSGKTTLVGPVQLDRVIMNAQIRAFYTAQTGKDAGARFNDLVKLVQGSALHAVAKYRLSRGDEAIRFPNGSELKPFAPVMAALHGETPPLVTLDEIWEYDELLGDALLEGAIIPAQVTLAGRRQIWMISTAGTALSTFMRKWVDRGRENVEALRAGLPAPYPKLAYFEWGLAEGDDPYDPAAIERFHPAVGQVINGKVFTAENLLENQVSRPTWLRAFCNVWTEAVNPLFTDEELDELADREVLEVPRRRDITVTYEISIDNNAGAVVASWRDVDGSPCNRVLHAAPGTSWMHDFIVEIRDTWKPAIIGADDGGPTRRLTDRLRRTLGDDAITTTGGVEYGTACEGWLGYARDRELKLDGSLTIKNGVKHLALKRVSDVTRFSRKDSTGSIAGPSAAAVGFYLHDHREVLTKPVLAV